MIVFKTLTASALLFTAAAAGATTVPFGYTIIDHQLVRIVPPVPQIETPGPVGAVPEPATWAMMVAGFGLVGIVRRRSRPRSVAA